MYDVIVAGGGPAGSTAAREAAAAGARVLLLDKAAFPREKPCGGGVNVRAAALLPFDLAPVVERTVTGVRFSLRTRGDFTRRYPRPLTYMTQRSRLDAFLVERAVEAGVDLHERDTVRGVAADAAGVTVRTARDQYRGRILIGADGANGIVARAAGLDGPRDLAVAFEGNVPFPDGLPAEWQQTAALDLGLIPGGYGWLFPKGDHVNVGVGGWKYTGPTLRARLDQVTRHYGLAPERLGGLRGHHLPVRRRGARIARGRMALVGDAAGLVDPLSGEGIYAAIASGRAAARHALAAIDGHTRDLTSYERAIDRMLGPELLASSQLQDIFNLAPPLYVALLRRSDLLWTLLCRIIRGEGDYASFKRRAGPIGLAVDAVSWLVRHTTLGRRAGRPEWSDED
jgi:geranylgeranyl reductase family protein